MEHLHNTQSLNKDVKEKDLLEYQNKLNIELRDALKYLEDERVELDLRDTMLKKERMEIDAEKIKLVHFRKKLQKEMEILEKMIEYLQSKDWFDSKLTLDHIRVDHYGCIDDKEPESIPKNLIHQCHRWLYNIVDLLETAKKYPNAFWFEDQQLSINGFDPRTYDKTYYTFGDFPGREENLDEIEVVLEDSPDSDAANDSGEAKDSSDSSKMLALPGNPPLFYYKNNETGKNFLPVRDNKGQRVIDTYVKAIEKHIEFMNEGNENMAMQWLKIATMMPYSMLTM
jgi:hypothetical protein